MGIRASADTGGVMVCHGQANPRGARMGEKRHGQFVAQAQAATDQMARVHFARLAGFAAAAEGVTDNPFGPDGAEAGAWAFCRRIGVKNEAARQRAAIDAADKIAAKARTLRPRADIDG